jgi:hypothetical protein
MHVRRGGASALLQSCQSWFPLLKPASALSGRVHGIGPMRALVTAAVMTEVSA